MLYDCVTWSPRACPYDKLRRRPTTASWLATSVDEIINTPTTQFPTYLNTPIIKTGRDSIEAIMRRRRIRFAGFVVRMENTRLPTCVMFGELVEGAGCMG